MTTIADNTPTRKLPDGINEPVQEQTVKIFRFIFWSGWVLVALMALVGFFGWGLPALLTTTPSTIEAPKGVVWWEAILFIVLWGVALVILFPILREKRREILDFSMSTFFLLAAWVFWQAGWLDETVRYCMYVTGLLVFSMHLVTPAYKGKTTSWWLSIAAFTILGLSHFYTYGQAKVWVVSKFNSPTGVTVRAPSYPRAAELPSCHNRRGSLTLGSSIEEINPGGFCYIYFQVDEGRATFVGPQGSVDAGPEGGDLRGLTMTGVRADPRYGYAKMRYITCAGRNIPNAWRCA